MKKVRTAATVAAIMLTAATSAERSFTAAMVDRLRAAYPAAKIEVTGDLQVSLSTPGVPANSAMTLYFNRVYALCAARYRDCESQRMRAIAGVADVWASGDGVVASALRVIVRPNAVVANNAAMVATNGNPVTRPIAPGLSLVLVNDTPNAIKWSTDRQLADAKLVTADAFDRGMRNTWADIDADKTVEQFTQGTITVMAGSAYQSSRMADADTWRRLARPGERLVVAVPSAEIMLVDRSPVGGDLAAMRATAGKLYADAQRAISPDLFEWTSKGWVVQR